MRSSGGWAKDKLDILRCYSMGFVNATKRAGQGAFIDGFAGPGLNFIRDASEVVSGLPAPFGRWQ